MRKLSYIVLALILMSVVAIGLAPNPVQAQANTTVSVSGVYGVFTACDAFGWTVNATVGQIVYDVPDAGAYGVARFGIEAPGYFNYRYDSNLGGGTFGPGPVTVTATNWGVGRSGIEVLPPNTPIYVTYYDGVSGAGAGFVVDCTTGSVLNYFSFPAQAGIGGCDAFIDLPSTAVVGTITDNAAVFADPGLSTNIVLTLGKTFWMDGLDASGVYRKVLVSCEWVWVEAAKTGPNFDEVWNGAPLPGHTVE